MSAANTINILVSDRPGVVAQLTNVFRVFGYDVRLRGLKRQTDGVQRVTFLLKGRGTPLPSHMLERIAATDGCIEVLEARAAGATTLEDPAAAFDNELFNDVIKAFESMYGSNASQLFHQIAEQHPPGVDPAAFLDACKETTGTVLGTEVAEKLFAKLYASLNATVT